MTPPAPTSFWDYLPAFFQQPESYFVMIVTFAVYGTLKALPPVDEPPWAHFCRQALPQVGALIMGMALSCSLRIGGSIAYSVGTGIIAGWGASSFYDMAFFGLTTKIRNLIGYKDKP